MLKNSAILLISILSLSNPLHARSSSKLDADGNYSSFRGVTVVSAVGSANAPLWEALSHSLNSNDQLKKYYSLLPLSSYHMTTINLFTEDATSVSPAEWTRFVAGRLTWFQELNTELNSQTFQPVITYQGVTVSGSVGLIVQMPQEMEDRVLTLAQRRLLTGQVPRFFHITLGYQYKEIAPQVRKQLANQLREEIGKIFDSYTQPLILDEPQLCYFNDMTAFVPWDGNWNPFADPALAARQETLPPEVSCTRCGFW
jgi:hypothetical protein